MALAAAIVGLAGCGGSGRGRTPNGQEIFAQDCSACHSLSGRYAPRRQGGDLRDLRVPRAAMLQFVDEMPVPARLTTAEARAVTDYVLEVERGRRREGDKADAR
jgi:mono/diheme cytochrome c family protein